MQSTLSYNMDITEDSIWITVTATQAARNSLAYVQELGDFHAGKTYYTDREYVPSFLVKLCLDGKGELDYQNQHYEIEAGQLFWLDCMDAQHYRTARDSDSWHVIWVHFYGAPCIAYYNLFLWQNNGRPVIDIGSDVDLQYILKMLLHIYKGDGNTLQDDIQSSGLLTQLMIRCIEIAAQSNQNQTLPSYVIDVRSFIHLHYADHITLDTLANAISINKFYLQKLFKQHMGLSPSEYLTHVRLTHAKRLLRTTNYPISYIGTEVGLGNVGYFISLFGKIEGITPNAYRRRWYQGQPDLPLSEL